MLDLKNKNVLITGGMGFIGSNLAHECLRLGAKVTIYDCLDPRSGGNIHNVSDIKNDIQIILNDIRNFEGVCAAVLDKDIIFNCAAYTSHPNAMKEPIIDIEVNCKGVINVLEAARRFNSEAKIVHIGTSTQIGKMKHDIIDELHPEFPVDIYSANKSVSEKYVLIYGNAYKMKTTVIRLTNTFGPRSNIKNSDFGFVNYFIGLGLQNKEITIFGKGEQLRSLVYIDDAVNALIAASINSNTDGEVFFVSSDIQYDVKTISTGIVNTIGGTLKFIDWPKNREVIEIGDAVISNAKIKKALNWTIETNLSDGLIKTKEYFSNKLKQYLA
jgi:UDP-glucose 4-epimerase